MTTTRAAIADEVLVERDRQDAKFPGQHLPDGTSELYDGVAYRAKQRTDACAASGSLTWRHVLDEEVAEAFAETDPVRLRAELIQVAAVAQRWVEDIDGRCPFAECPHPDRCGAGCRWTVPDAVDDAPALDVAAIAGRVDGMAPADTDDPWARGAAWMAHTVADRLRSGELLEDQPGYIGPDQYRPGR